MTKPLDQVLYEAFSAEASKGMQGVKCVSWDSLTPQVQAIWKAVADAAQDYINKPKPTALETMAALQAFVDEAKRGEDM